MVGKVYCALCELRTNSPRSFCQHLNGLKHRTLMALQHPNDMAQLYRVQYILDTYMQSYPIVGLEYVAEMRGETSCYYTCELCKVGRDWQEMVVHVTGVEHAKLFIQQHYSHMISSGEEEELMELREATKAIFHKEGRKKIRMLEPDTGYLDLPAAVVSPSSGKDGENPQQKAASSESALLWKFNNKRNEHWRHRCNVCSISCSSARMLCEHITGKKHKNNLEIIRSRDVKEVHRLSYFLRQHMKEEPILGLEYVIEMKNGMFWRFFCQLCNIMASKLVEIVLHITHEKHTVSYIKKHHADLWTPDLQDGDHDKEFLLLLREISVKILKEHGPKDIQVIFDPHAYKILQGKLKKASKANKEDDARPSKHDNRKSSHSKRRPSPRREIENRDGYKKELKKSEVDDPPLAKRGRLSREEDQEALPSRPHKSKTGDLRQTERHTRSDMFYLEEDREASPSKPDSSQQTERHARSVMLCLEGEQESSPSRSDSSQPRESQQTERQARSVMFCQGEEQESSSPRFDTLNSMDLHSPTQDATLEATTAIHELEFHTNYQLLEYLANFQIDNDQDAAFIQVITQNCIKALTRFQEEEAERLGITRQHEALLASASRTLPEIPLTSVNEARSPSPEPVSTSDPSSELFPKNDITETPEVLVNKARSPLPELETLWPVDTADQSLEFLPKNDITDFFFSSIKDMDESEVVGVFQRIATTNPEFRGMDIPAVIRILKDSGKLKKS